MGHFLLRLLLIFLHVLFYISKVKSVSLWNLLLADPSVSLFVKAVSDNQLQSLFLSTSCIPFNCSTVFVPSNNALYGFNGTTISQPFLRRHVFNFVALPALSPLKATMGTMANYKSIGTGVQSPLAFNLLPRWFGDNRGFGDLYWFYSATQPAINYINNARIIRPDNIADNGVYHVISRPLYPAGVSNKLDTYLRANSSLSVFVELWQTLTNVDATVNAFYNFDDTLALHATVFIPSNAVWSDVPSTTYNSLLNNITFLKDVMMYHFAATQITFPQWILETNQSLQLNMNFGDDAGKSANITYDGNFYITAGGITARILDPEGTPLKQCVVYRIDRPLGFIYQTKISWLKKYANAFLTSCQSDTDCLSLLQTPQTTVIAIKDSGIDQWTTLLTSNSTRNISISMHFLANNKPLILRNSGDQLMPLAGSAIIRYRRNADTGEFIDSRTIGNGFLSSKIVYKDLIGTDGNVIVVENVICCTARQTIYDILMDSNISGGKYSSFLSNWTNTFFKFSDVAGFLTLFVPTNTAMNAFATQGGPIFTDPAKRIKVLQRHLIVNVASVADFLPSSRALYKAATANYRDLKEYIDIKLVDKSTAIMSYSNKSINVDLRQGGLLATNGYIYPVEYVLFVNTD